MRLSNLKKWYVVSGLVIFTLLIGIIAINATIMHSGHDFEISIDGADESLQNIITENDFTIPHTYTMPSTIPDPGHGPDEIWVSVNGSEMTLQDAISTTGLCGITSPTTSYSSPDIPNPIHFATEIDVSSGTTLQDAINSGALVSVNGNWTVWSAWNTCSVECGGGTQTRTRTCTNPAPYCAGANCTGDDSESRVCNTQPCYTYSWYYSSWSTCSVSCGGGTQTRTVYCKRNDGTNMGATCDVYLGCECSTKPSTSQSCNTQDCPTYTYSWYTGSCSVSCGGGTRTVYCKRSDNVQVSDSYCSGTKPSTTCNTGCCLSDWGESCTSGCCESGLTCCSECNRCYWSCPNALCQDCTPDCDDDDIFPCGTTWTGSDGCDGTCWGTGTWCPSDQYCYAGSCYGYA